MKNIKKSRKNYVIIALVVILLSLAVGYAAFTASLTVNGSATGSGTWDVHFKSATLKDSTGATDTAHGSEPTISGDGNSVTVDVKLNYPGDGVILETVIENSGTVPAKLTNYNFTGITGDLEVTEANPSTNEILNANGGTCTSQFAIKWKNTSTVESIAKQTFTVTFNYEQGTVSFNATPTHSDN